MKIVVVQRITLEPKEIADLTVSSNVIQQGRVGMSLNEGDVKSIELVNQMKLAFDVIQVGDLDNTKRVHTFVRGAESIYELTGVYPYQVSEEKIAEAVVSQVKSIGVVSLIVMSPVEQDSGRNGLPGLIAGKLNWDLFSEVTTIKNEGEGIVFTQNFESGVQSLKIQGPAVLTSFEGCELGDDPSDQYDLIEKLEKKESIKKELNSLVSELVEAKINSIVPPKEPEPQPIKKLDEAVASQIMNKIKEYI